MLRTVNIISIPLALVIPILLLHGVLFGWGGGEIFEPLIDAITLNKGPLYSFLVTLSLATFGISSALLMRLDRNRSYIANKISALVLLGIMLPLILFPVVFVTLFFFAMS